VKSHRIEREEVPGGTTYEAVEGARAGRAVREPKCQVVDSSGGAAVRIPKLTLAGRKVGKVKDSPDVITNKFGDGCEKGAWPAVYSERSAEQQPESAQCDVEFSEAGSAD
jgi:hypothetical protein